MIKSLFQDPIKYKILYDQIKISKLCKLVRPYKPLNLGTKGSSDWNTLTIFTDNGLVNLAWSKDQVLCLVCHLNWNICAARKTATQSFVHCVFYPLLEVMEDYWTGNRSSHALPPAHLWAVVFPGPKESSGRTMELLVSGLSRTWVPPLTIVGSLPRLSVIFSSVKWEK